MARTIENPVEALVEVGKVNSEIHEELMRCYAEVDRYRNALDDIMKMPFADIAADPTKPGVRACLALSNGTMSTPPEQRQ